MNRKIKNEYLLEKEANWTSLTSLDTEKVLQIIKNR